MPAKAAVAEFIDSIGYGVVDAGVLSDSWRQEPGTPVYATPYGPFSDEKGHPAGKDAVRAALTAATQIYIQVDLRGLRTPRPRHRQRTRRRPDCASAHTKSKSKSKSV